MSDSKYIEVPNLCSGTKPIDTLGQSSEESMASEQAQCISQPTDFDLPGVPAINRTLKSSEQGLEKKSWISKVLGIFR